MSKSAIHARQELDLIGEDPEVIDWYCKVIDTFHELGHSGGSFYATLPVLTRLLEQKNLSPLTNNPEEWMDVQHITGTNEGLFQNKRNSEAFSHDGGNTFHLLPEGANSGNRKPIHTSAIRDKT